MLEGRRSGPSSCWRPGNLRGGGDCFGNLRQVARSMNSQPFGTLGQALNCRLARGVGKVIFFYHAMAAKSQLCDKSLWVRACYNF